MKAIKKLLVNQRITNHWLSTKSKAHRNHADAILVAFITSPTHPAQPRKEVGTGMDKCNVRLHGESSYTKNSSPFVHLLYVAVLVSKVRSHFIIIYLSASDLVCTPKLLHNSLFVCLIFYYIHLEITGYSCNLIGCQRCDIPKSRHLLL